MVSEVAAFGRHNARLEPVPTALPPGDRAARGKAARAAVPRESHAYFKPAVGRPDPVSSLERQAMSRIPELLPIRYGRMAASPFAFFRGAALMMAGDLADTPASGLIVQTCGDAHLSNFGIFGSPERRLVFDINDFDETLPGPWEWDVKRLAASAEVAARENGFGRKQRHRIVVAAVARYRRAMRRLAGMGEVEAWQSPAEVDDLKKRFHTILSWRERRLAARRLTSHSHGPGRVSSKSLTSKSSLRSGEAYRPKLDRCASPQTWTVRPDTGVVARSLAMTRAAPRKKANGEAAIRPYRTGSNSGSRDTACRSSRLTGSGRPTAGLKSAWFSLGTAARAPFPRAARSPGGRAVGTGSSRALCRPNAATSLTTPGSRFSLPAGRRARLADGAQGNGSTVENGPPHRRVRIGRSGLAAQRLASLASATDPAPRGLILSDG